MHPVSAVLIAGGLHVLTANAESLGTWYASIKDKHLPAQPPPSPNCHLTVCRFIQVTSLLRILIFMTDERWVDEGYIVTGGTRKCRWTKACISQLLCWVSLAATTHACARTHMQRVREKKLEKGREWEGEGCLSICVCASTAYTPSLIIHCIKIFPTRVVYNTGQHCACVIQINAEMPADPGSLSTRLPFEKHKLNYDWDKTF